MSLMNEWRSSRLARHQEIQKRQQVVLAHRQNTQDWLTNRHEVRRDQALQDRLDRENYVQNLQDLVDRFLATTEKERSEMAEVLWQKLNDFARNLANETADFLHARSNFRYVQGQQQAQELQQFCQNVSSYVAQFLSESREKRLAEVEDLFDRLSIFRGQLQQFHLQLQNSVWGEGNDDNRSILATSVEVSTKTHQDLAKTKVVPTLGAGQKPDKLVNGGRGTEQPTDNYPPKSGSLATETRSENVTTGVIITSTVSSDVSSSLTTLSSSEQLVYNYLQKNNHAQLRDIEKNVGLKRIEVVDALRSLMAKNLISQSDNRSYSVLPIN